jgi:hypothetical protein
MLLNLLSYALQKQELILQEIQQLRGLEDYTGARVGNNTAKNKYLYETLESLQQQFAASTALATPEQAFEPD